MIQIDIKMPSSCRECPFRDRDDDYCTLFSYGCPDRYDIEYYIKRSWWCGLEEVTES